MEALQVPYLRSGKGDTPADGGCLLQVIDWVDRMEWSDNPRCVNQMFHGITIAVNDGLADDKRQGLLDLAPRLMGTASMDSVVAVRLAVVASKQVLPVLPRFYPSHGKTVRQVARDAIEAVEKQLDEPASDRREGHSDLHSHARAVGEAASGLNSPYKHCYAARCVQVTLDAAAASTPLLCLARADSAVLAATRAIINRDGLGELLVKMLDEYDRLTGRTQKPEPLDFSGVCAAMTPVGV